MRTQIGKYDVDFNYHVYGKYEDDIQIDEINLEQITDENGREVDVEAMVPGERFALEEALAEYVCDNCQDDMYQMWFENNVSAAEYERDCAEDR